MPRRVTLPGADELFRPTAPGRRTQEDAPAASTEPAVRHSGRVKHDEKITVYVTSEELLALEQARLSLRTQLGRNVDRGRVVRAALGLALDDLEARGEESDVVARLRNS